MRGAWPRRGRGECESVTSVGFVAGCATRVSARATPLFIAQPTEGSAAPFLSVASPLFIAQPTEGSAAPFLSVASPGVIGRGGGARGPHFAGELFRSKPQELDITDA